MKEIILDSLKKIERDYNVKIVYACESGSRAWGYPSSESDFDVRFIYVHKKEDYLTIDPIGIGSKQDVIELPITDDLDISGWELTKTLRLFRKSNPPLMEWLHSGKVYYQAFSTIERMLILSKTIFDSGSCLHHYLNMADKNFRKYLLGEEVKIKQYFTVLRPILASGWIEKYNEFPPVEFPTLLNKLVPEGKLKHEMRTLINRKMDGEDLEIEPKIIVINHFLNEELTRLHEFSKTLNKDSTNFTPKLDLIFRDTLEEAWN